jgi:hypothetical protein
MTRIVREVFPWATLLVALVVAALVAQPIAAASAKATQCGASGRNSVSSQFAIPAASRIFDYFPNMGKSPELSADDQPAYVVVFNNPYVAPVRVAQGRAATLAAQQDVICVLQADGTVNVYADVSRVGFKGP